ncbi:hypothetical protein CEXT_399361 [Caerostris extrusa]|uniref:Maturase K n=1 Tax=Caerostris extrusa TaxID=172846 RepID=A0AAV4QM97_CAEEX|nr:hypothetical protein CEXT_399361 [Caerostris extrusa]
MISRLIRKSSNQLGLSKCLLRIFIEHILRLSFGFHSILSPKIHSQTELFRYVLSYLLLPKIVQRPYIYPEYLCNPTEDSKNGYFLSQSFRVLLRDNDINSNNILDICLFCEPSSCHEEINVICFSAQICASFPLKDHTGRHGTTN